MHGNTGKVMKVDLTAGTTDAIEVEEDTYRQYVGGAGLAAALMMEMGDLDADPLDPRALLVFATGPMAATGMYGTSRFSAGARSPLTGIWGQSSCGGTFGPELKKCGYDAVVLVGRAAEPVYMLITEEGVGLLPAAQLWGKDTYETTDFLKEKHGRRYKVLAIGPAAENGVPFGSITNDYAHHFGRAGMGTVMGSKNVKAIVAKGDRAPEYADPEGFRELWQDTIRPQVEESIFCRSLQAFGTAANMEMKVMQGDVPIRNWSRGTWMEAPETLSGIAMADTIRTDTKSCRGCVVKCKPVVKVAEGPYQVNEGPGPEYETIAAFGTMLMNKNLPAVAAANELCNRLGMDTMTCGSTIAWAMDCYEAGLLKPENYEGVELEWGEMGTVLDLIPRIAARVGKLGGLLALGSRAAAAEIGGGSERFLTDSKGLEAPMHDPRCNWGDGLAYAVSVRGACHVSNLMFLLEWGAIEYPELGLDMILKEQATEHKAFGAAVTSDMGAICNSACWCEFPATALTLPNWVDAFNTVAGYGYDIGSMMEAGARIWHLQRCLGFAWGATGADDRLGERLMTPTEDGMIAGSVPDMETMLREFYELRGLETDGRPTRETLTKYGLDSLAASLLSGV
ncbi:MAG: aldehyde ferredoxin oxidoreductase family protein [Candidatus Geothermincolia bacterium]